MRVPVGCIDVELDAEESRVSPRLDFPPHGVGGSYSCGPCVHNAYSGDIGLDDQSI